MNTLINYFEDLVALFYPNLCFGCEENVPPRGRYLCTHCDYKIAKTNFHLDKENYFTKRFWGRLKLETAAAFYIYIDGGRCKKLISNFKYKGQQEIGVVIGQRYGHMLREQEHFKDIDIIIPVPMHINKRKIRGFNQSASFAKGLSESMELPWTDNAMERIFDRESQTKKGLLGRIENADLVYQVSDPKLLANKHVLLVDDVITTGSTLEGCGLKILEVGGTRLSFVTIAITMN